AQRRAIAVFRAVGDLVEGSLNICRTGHALHEAPIAAAQGMVKGIERAHERDYTPPQFI
ncbi:MAG: hypothetical protein HY259_12805, partial [Chloroflexi bacterium]|nr:hypothetical protein [Chloroflexota bacterium]